MGAVRRAWNRTNVWGNWFSRAGISATCMAVAQLITDGLFTLGEFVVLTVASFVVMTLLEFCALWLSEFLVGRDRKRGRD